MLGLKRARFELIVLSLKKFQSILLFTIHNHVVRHGHVDISLFSKTTNPLTTRDAYIAIRQYVPTLSARA